MPAETNGLTDIDSLAWAEALIVAKRPEEKAKAVACALGEVSGSPFGTDPAWMMVRLTSAGLRPEQALVARQSG